MRTAEFFALARERYHIFLRREAGEKAPWTKDEILRQFKFCNVFREDDRTTIWIRENIREPLRNDPKVFQAIVIARWFNRVSTMERIKDILLEDSWTHEKGEALLRGVSPLLSAAYLIRSPQGMDKLTGMLWQIDQCLEAVRAKAQEMASSSRAYTLQEITEWLARFPGIGEFLAYEVVSDLRHTFLLENAPDIMTWANPGPGCEKGIRHLLGGSTGGKANMVLVMQQLVEASRDPENWPAEWPAWEMREAEHMLCEFDKYERTRLGEGTPKQLFNGGGVRTIAYGQGKGVSSPKKVVDPTEVLIQSKLKPMYEEIDAIKAEIATQVLERAARLIEGVEPNWLPYVEEILVSAAGEEHVITVTPPTRLPSFFQEEGVTLDYLELPLLSTQFRKIREVEEKITEREKAIREVLGSM